MSSESSEKFYDALQEEPLDTPKLYTPLHIAARIGNIGEVKNLLRYSNIDVNNAENAYGMTPLHWAALNGHINIVKALLKYPGIDTKKEDNNGMTAIDLAKVPRYGKVVSEVVKAIKEEELANKKYKQGRLKQRMLSFAQTHRDSKVGGRRKSRRAIKSKRKRQTKRRRR